MLDRIGIAGAVAITFALTAIPASQAVDPKPKDEPTLSELSLQVAALQSMHRFDLTREQLQLLRKLFEDIAPKDDKRKPGKASDKIRKRMFDLRDALLNGNEERIDELEEKLADMLDEEETDIDDRVRVTAAATKKALEMLKSLRLAQVAAFYSRALDDVPEPLETLLSALEVVGSLKDPEWNDLAKDIIEDLQWQLGSGAGEKVEPFLKMLRALDEAALEKQRPDLEKAARELVAQVPPTIILHNFVEHTLAELLSNPAVAVAVAARLEALDKQKQKDRPTEKK
jgi:hypothetical protein